MRLNFSRKLLRREDDSTLAVAAAAAATAAAVSSRCGEMSRGLLEAEVAMANAAAVADVLLLRKAKKELEKENKKNKKQQKNADPHRRPKPR